jgi:hypothetical protein
MTAQNINFSCWDTLYINVINLVQQDTKIQYYEEE